MNSEARNQLVEQFRAYLDDTASKAADNAMQANSQLDSLPSSQSATKNHCDLFSLFTELTALKNEVRLESRQLKVALEKFGELFDNVREGNLQLTRQLNTQRETSAHATAEAESKLLLEIVDLRDRLQAGLDTAVGYRATGFARLSGAPSSFINSLAEGMAISLRRTDELLARYGVASLPAIGLPLDPSTMHANAVESHTDKPDGTIITEVRKGYTRNGEVLRIAEVVVNKLNTG